MYSNREGDAQLECLEPRSTFYDAKKDDCVRFIQMCIDILDNDSDEEMFDICQKDYLQEFLNAGCISFSNTSLP